MKPAQTKFKSPLHEMACTTATDLWNDSCFVQELDYALEHGAVGATSNPVIVGEVLQKELPFWKDRIAEIAGENPSATEDDLAWRLIEAMAIRAAARLEPIFDREKGKKGRLSLQTHPKFHRSAEMMVRQAEHFVTLAPNLQVKLPVTKAGIQAIEEATARGISVNATVSTTVAQAIAVAEAVERGLRNREARGLSNAEMSPVCTIMVGRLDDWLKVVAERDDIITNPEVLDWAGVAVLKKAYRIYKERGYRARLLSAAYRGHRHWSEFIGGDVILSIPCKWQKRFNASDVEVVPRMDRPVDPAVTGELCRKFEEFRKAYDEEGLSVGDFDHYGATRRTLRQFIAGYEGVVQFVRDRLVPNPDLK